MRLRVEHRIPGRLRVRLAGNIPAQDAVALESCLLERPGVLACTVYGRTGSIALRYREGAGAHQTTSEPQLLDLLATLRPDDLGPWRPTPQAALALRDGGLFEGVVHMCAVRLVTRYLLPYPLRAAWTLIQVGRFVYRGLRSLLRARLDVPVLDAVALSTCLARRDFATAGSAMWLIGLSELIEDKTRRFSEQELVSSLLHMPERVHRVIDGEETSCDASELVEGDVIVVRTGAALPVDGEVASGEGWVNQSTLTGESASVLRQAGDDVFAGTALEEGELFVRVKATPEHTRLRAIVELVRASDSHKSLVQQRMERLANRIVPLNLLFAAAVFAVTRSLDKLNGALMVDYSCALRLTGSIAALAASAEAAHVGLRVKGSRSFEAIASADTIVFDKTGTLTLATPSVSSVCALDGWDETEVLRLSACLEEHFPHPVARAVVNEAARRGIDHRERHAEVEFIVAHGIASSLDGQRVIVGSGHFVFEDEGVPRDAALDGLLAEQHPDASPLFLAVNGKLVGMLLIRDPLKPHVAETLDALRQSGLRRVVMLTGDNAATARCIAHEAGIDEYAADLLPEDKHEYVRRLKEEGATIVMVGDGINDSPALACADVGIATGEGAAIAREVADVTLATDDLGAIVSLRRISERLVSRTNASYAASIAVNTALLLAGTAGALTPAASSLLHNGATALLSASGTRRLL
ncbi:MAG: heavy metal translocating P-type ATPase [Coriobacteriales bacterium]|jgi:heavy metal translocating P-type ATPase|nr:heavy metal translocating P-type ATPase [Coriobacteriales bacterium]